MHLSRSTSFESDMPSLKDNVDEDETMFSATEAEAETEEPAESTEAFKSVSSFQNISSISPSIFLNQSDRLPWRLHHVWHAFRRALLFDTQAILAIPLFLILVVFFVLEGSLYILVRTIGRLLEKFLTRPKVRHAIRLMRRAEDYNTYARCALALDKMTGRNLWKKDLTSNSNYDSTGLERRINEFRENLAHKKIEKLWSLVSSCVEMNLHNTLHPSHYSVTYIGTKFQINKYHVQLHKAIWCLKQHIKQQPQHASENLKKSSELCQSFGATALAFSGGAMLGLHHLGVLEALIEMNLLPKVISGTSAGSIIAAFACTRSDTEILEFLRDPTKTRSFREPFDPNNCLLRLVNFLRYGYTVNFELWVRTGENLFQNLTFQEAYDLTGRVLNVTLSRADNVDDYIVVNYKNAANVLIVTAVLASSAFPYLGFPTHLIEKDPITGNLHRSQEYYSCFYRDGSLRGDVPCDYLRAQWNVKYIIVSQVNPHIFPFFDLRSHGSPGQPIRGWCSSAIWRGGFPLAMFEVILKEHLRFLLRLLALLEIVPAINGINIAHVAFQNYGGDLNISPSRLYCPHIQFMNNVSPKRMRWFMQIGQQMAFPKIWLLKTRISVERALESLVTTAQEVSNEKHDSFQLF